MFYSIHYIPQVVILTVLLSSLCTPNFRFGPQYQHWLSLDPRPYVSYQHQQTATLGRAVQVLNYGIHQANQMLQAATLETTQTINIAEDQEDSVIDKSECVHTSKRVSWQEPLCG
jgi:hypothetical protein